MRELLDEHMNIPSNQRFFMTEYGIPTIQLGTGDIIMSDLNPANEEDLYTGVCFTLTEHQEIGKDYTEIHKGKTVVELGAFFQIISTSPESLQILADKIEIAKKTLETRIEQSQEVKS